MRAVLVVAVLALVGFAGCAESEPPAQSEEADNFDDVQVEVDDDTGAIRGVVFNDAIVPVEGAQVGFTESGEERTAVTDAQGRFAFSKIQPGTYFLTISKQLHEETQTTVTVEAGVKEPAIIKVQINRMFSEDAYWELIHFQGFFTCAIAIGASTTCVNDYTRLCGNVDPSCCPGGCLQQITGVVDHREYVTPLEESWQSIILELVWDSSLAGTSDTMGMTMSYYARIGASHNWGCGSGESPFQCRRDYEDIGGEDDFPNKIPPEGIEDLFVFMSAGGGNVALQQEFEVFHNEFFLGLPPEGWSFVNGDGDPF